MEQMEPTLQLVTPQMEQTLQLVTPQLLLPWTRLLTFVFYHKKGNEILNKCILNK